MFLDAADGTVPQLLFAVALTGTGLLVAYAKGWLR
jgi:hypothetical protein